MKTKKFALSVIATSVIAAMSASVYADDAPFYGDVFSMPQYMGSNTKIKTVEVEFDLTRTQTQDFTTIYKKDSSLKPNIMLLIDDSNSMRSADGAGYGGRFMSVRHYMLTIFGTKNPHDKDNKSYLDSANWGVTNFMRTYSVGNGNRNIVPVVPITTALRWNPDGSFNGEGTSSSTERTKKSFEDAEMREAYQTPTIGSYLRATNDLYSSIDYRCRKNYLIMFTDGKPEGTPYFDTYKNFNLWNGNVSTSLKDGMIALRAKAYRSTYGLDRYFTATGGGAGSKNLYEVSDLLHNRDLKTNGKDAAGKDWTGNQTIDTFVISGWVEAGHAENIIKMATPLPKKDDNGNIIGTYPIRDHSGFIANNSNEVKVAFEKIIDTIAAMNVTPDPGDGQLNPNPTPDPSGSNIGAPTSAERPDIKSEESYAGVSPSVSSADRGSLTPNEGAVVFLYPGMNAGDLRFYKFDWETTKVLPGSSTDDANDTLTGLDIDDPKYSNPDNYLTPDYSSRKVLVTKGSQAEWADSLPDSMFDNDYFSLEDQDDISDKEWQKALIPWLARGEKDEHIKGLGYNKNVYTGEGDDKKSAYRVRSSEQRNMGDVVNSDVVSIGGLYSIKYNGSDGTEREVKRNRFLITSANDGMAYIFEVNPKEKQEKDAPYFLKLNYLPTQMLSEQDGDDKATGLVAEKYKRIAHESYVSTEKPHQYMMDGNISAQRMKLYDSAKPGTAKEFTTYMVGNMGRAGRGSYALHLQQGDDVFLDDKDKLRLFEFSTKTSSESHNDTSGLGFTVPQSTVGRVSGGNHGGVVDSDGSLLVTEKDVHLISFIPSGYAGHKDLKKQETALYLVETSADDAGTDGGSLSGVTVGSVRKISVPGGLGGLSAPTLFDANYDGVVDYAFAGDYAGNMYRFDVRDLRSVSVDRIFESEGTWEDGKAPTKPITSAPTIARNANNVYVVIWGTGTDLYASDRSLNDQQSIYGIFQKVDIEGGTLDVIDDPNNKGIKANDIKVGQLLPQEFIEGSNGFRYITNNEIREVDPTTKALGEIKYAGWKVDLDSKNGERVVTKGTTVLRTAYLTSRWYESDGVLTGDTACSNFNADRIDQSGNYIADSSDAGDRWKKIVDTNSTGDDWSGMPADMCKPIEKDNDDRVVADPKELNMGNINQWLAKYPGQWSNLVDIGNVDKDKLEIPTDVKNNPNHKDYEYWYGDPKDPCSKSIDHASGHISQCLQTGGKRKNKYVCEENVTGEVKLKSAVIQLNTNNGGAIYIETARKDNNSFMRWGSGLAEFGTYGYAASLTLNGIANVTVTGYGSVAATDLDGTEIGPSNTRNSGEMDPSGDLMDLKRHKNNVSERPKKCAGKDSIHGATVNISTTTGDSLGVKDHFFGAICGVKRISWREIF